MSGTVRSDAGRQAGREAVLVVGAAGTVGRAVVAAALAAGRPVIAVARNAAALRTLRSAHRSGDLQPVAGSVSDDASAAALVEALRTLGRPISRVVVAIAAAPQRGRLLDASTGALQRRLDTDLVPHLAAARHLLPLMAASGRGGSYVIIGGPGSEQPWAGYGHRSVAAAALRMLATALHEEARAMSMRLQLLSVDTPVRSDANRQHACSKWPEVQAVAERALALVACDRCTEATLPVVSFAARTTPARAADASKRATRIAGSAAATDMAQGPDSAACEATRRSLDDARTLLRTLLPPSPKKVSPP